MNSDAFFYDMIGHDEGVLVYISSRNFIGRGLSPCKLLEQHK